MYGYKYEYPNLLLVTRLCLVQVYNYPRYVCFKGILAVSAHIGYFMQYFINTD